MLLFLEVAAGGGAAFLFGTFMEYFVHRLMHWGLLFPKGHIHHHMTGDARTMVKDILDYAIVALAVGWMGFVVSVPAGLGWIGGCLVYVVTAAYAHQLQHANAHLLFWMPRPVHAIHHALDQRDCNFGVVVDWWDRLFGTYRPVEWPKPEKQKDRLRGYADIPWINETR